MWNSWNSAIQTRLQRTRSRRFRRCYQSPIVTPNETGTWLAVYVVADSTCVREMLHSVTTVRTIQTFGRMNCGTKFKCLPFGSELWTENDMLEYLYSGVRYLRLPTVPSSVVDLADSPLEKKRLSCMGGVFREFLMPRCPKHSWEMKKNTYKCHIPGTDMGGVGQLNFGRCGVARVPETLGTPRILPATVVMCKHSGVD